MEAFNNWLREIQTTNSGDVARGLYGTTGTVCVILLILSAVLYIWRQRLNPLKGLVIGFLVYYFLGYAQHLVTWYRRDFALDNYIGTANIGYGFILLPLFCWLCDKTFNTPDGTSGELAAITTLAWHVAGRSGCTFTGCCYGIDCSWGIYSRYPDGNTFPVCWLESLLTLGILIFLVVRLLRRGYAPEGKKSRYRIVNWFYSKRRQQDNGRALPWMLLLYGGGRFFTEFLRHHDTDDVLFGFVPSLSLVALLMAAVGGILLYYSFKKEKALAVEGETLPVLNGQRK